MSTLIRNGLVVTFEPDALRGRVIADGAVAIEDGRIEVSETLRETTQPTRRIVTVVVWIFALHVAAAVQTEDVRDDSS